MKTLSEQIGESTGAKFENTTEVKLTNQQTAKKIKQLTPVLLGFVALGTWIALSVANGNLFIKEVLAASLIISCVLMVRVMDVVKSK